MTDAGAPTTRCSEELLSETLRPCLLIVPLFQGGNASNETRVLRSAVTVQDLAVRTYVLGEPGWRRAVRRVRRRGRARRAGRGRAERAPSVASLLVLRVARQEFREGLLVVREQVLLVGLFETPPEVHHGGIVAVSLQRFTKAVVQQVTLSEDGVNLLPLGCPLRLGQAHDCGHDVLLRSCGRVPTIGEPRNTAQVRRGTPCIALYTQGTSSQAHVRKIL